MKWVLVVWTLWTTNGVPTVDVKHSEVYYPSRHTCELAIEDFVKRYEPYTKEGFGYSLKCMTREEWENLQARDTEDGD